MRTVTIEQQSAMLKKRKEELGLSDRSVVPANSGKNRTHSKRAMLKELEKSDARNGNKSGFKANY